MWANLKYIYLNLRELMNVLSTLLRLTIIRCLLFTPRFPRILSNWEISSTENSIISSFPKPFLIAKTILDSIEWHYCWLDSIISKDIPIKLSFLSFLKQLKMLIPFWLFPALWERKLKHISKILKVTKMFIKKLLILCNCIVMTFVTILMMRHQTIAKIQILKMKMKKIFLKCLLKKKIRKNQNRNKKVRTTKRKKREMMMMKMMMKTTKTMKKATTKMMMMILILALMMTMILDPK